MFRFCNAAAIDEETKAIFLSTFIDSSWRLLCVHMCFTKSFSTRAMAGSGEQLSLR